MNPVVGLKEEKKPPLGMQLKQVRYFNNTVEQNHCFIPFYGGIGAIS
ncbi:hypothetical protein [Peribacillus simplex]|nr:hypothetical protein [Peribacillus simplex]